MSDQIGLERIERTRAQLYATKIPAAKIDHLSNMLDDAKRICSGKSVSVEDLSKAIGVLIEDRVKEQMDRAAECLVCMSKFSGWQGFVIQVKWPIAVVACVAFFSPHFDKIAAIAVKLGKLAA